MSRLQAALPLYTSSSRHPSPQTIHLTPLPRIAETLPQAVLTLMHAPAKPAYPIIEPEQLPEFDGYIFGVPTRYGNFPAQWKTFWDKSGALWASGALFGKFGAVFVSTGSQGGGQETTVANSLSTLVHHGIIFVPLGYGKTFAEASSFEEIHGGALCLSLCYGRRC